MQSAHVDLYAGHRPSGERDGDHRREGDRDREDRRLGEDRVVVVSPKVWPGPDSEGSPIGWTLANPGIVSIPLGFIGCWLGTMLTREAGAERTFAELHVRSETGIGSEQAAVSV